FKKMSEEERLLFQKKLNRIHDFFIEEVAQNRDLSLSKARELATGEFYLGVEAQELGLVDELGDKTTAEEYMKKTYNLDDVSYVVYERQLGLFELLSGVIADQFFRIGEGIGAVFIRFGGVMV
ncbi:MAG: S49 family peptidase, partial [Nanoarchaeota archaeon]